MNSLTTKLMTDWRRSRMIWTQQSVQHYHETPALTSWRCPRGGWTRRTERIRDTARVCGISGTAGILQHHPLVIINIIMIMVTIITTTLTLPLLNNISINIIPTIINNIMNHVQMELSATNNITTGLLIFCSCLVAATKMVIISICLFPILTPDLSIIYEATWDLDLATLTRLTNCSFISSTWNWTLSSVLSGQELYNVRMRVLENILRIMTTFLTHVLKMDSYPAATSQLPVTIIDTIMVSWEGDFLTRMLWRRSLGAASWQVGLQMTSLSTESIQSTLITVDPIIMLVGLVMDTLVKSPSHYSHLANYFSITRLQTSWA